MEKTFSVAVEMNGGDKRTLTVRGKSSGDAFQQVKAMAGVRRVGRIAEAGAGDGSGRREQKSDERRGQQSPGAATASVFTGAGPRVVISSRQGGEQPFKNLYVPPERLAVPKPAPPPAAPKAVAVAKPVMREAPPVTGAEESSEAREPTPSVEYRIVRSRRQNGEPFLLQRGQWRDLKGKRVFGVDWEKGFADRDKAESHQRWMRQMAAEIAEAATDDEGIEVEEVEEVEA